MGRHWAGEGHPSKQCISIRFGTMSMEENKCQEVATVSPEILGDSLHLGAYMGRYARACSHDRRATAGWACTLAELQATGAAGEVL